MVNGSSCNNKFSDSCQQGIRNNESILIHCNAGVSRSGAVCVGWLMKIFNSVSFKKLDIEARTGQYPNRFIYRFIANKKRTIDDF